MKVQLKKNDKVYVVCPANIKTGGTELAHQLVSILCEMRIEAYICYISNEKVEVPNAFLKYVADGKILEDVEDEESNLIILPEAWTNIARRYKNIRKAVWWMSVDNYEKNASISFAFSHYGVKQACKTLAKKIAGRNVPLNNKELKEISYHFVQSGYAYDFLKKRGIPSAYLSDYINEYFYGISYNASDKQDIIVYNPQKGYKITKKIMQAYDKAQWIPLINMTNDEVRKTLLRAKVYVDFGPFPGKDRIPREAALSYCCVLTGTFGAAAFEGDLPIQSQYKFGNPLHSVRDICATIDNCINNYSTYINDFSPYRTTIMGEKDTFMREIALIFEVNNNG